MKKRVLITGGTKGIGRAIALHLAKEGYDLTLTYVRDDGAAEKCLGEVRSLKTDVQLLKFDIADRSQAKTLLTKNIEEFGAFYGIVCNAGLIRDNAFPALSDEDWDLVMRTNLDSFYNIIHPCVMPMIRSKKGGRIITLSSVSGIMGNRGQVNYSASKAGIIGATKALAVELASRNITVNCIAPGLIDTGMVEKEIIDQALEAIPMKRMGTAEEVASLAAYLMSDSASYITRQAISVNGGLA